MPWVPGLTVRVWTHERAHVGRQRTVDALLDLVRDRKLAGVTVTRALEGQGAHGALRQSGRLALSDDLPLVVEMVDRAERIEPLLADIAALVTSGVLTVSATRLYVPASGLRVRDVMIAPKAVVQRETPLTDALPAFLEDGARLVPVVAPDQTLVGVLTLGQIFAGLNATVSSQLLEKQTSEQLRARLMDSVAGQTAGSRMNTRPFVVSPELTLDDAGQYLTRSHVTRVPVVDSGGRLIGLLSERELVGALVAPLTAPPLDGSSEHSPAEGDPHSTPRLCVLPGEGGHLTAETLADRDAPSVSASAPWDAVVRALHATGAGLAIVVDAEGRLLGVIDERSLLEHALPDLSGGSRSAVRRILTRAPGRVSSFLHARPGAEMAAAALMRRDVQQLPAALPIAEALARMLEGPRSDVAVVTSLDGRPLGVLWRDDALRALVTPGAPETRAGVSDERARGSDATPS